MWLGPSSISLDSYDSKIRKASRYRPAVSNETILATRQEFFFTKVAPVQSITDIVLFDFWLMLLCLMFTSSYTTIYFFVKKFIFSNVYISVNTIFECLYMLFWLRKGSLIKYVRNWQPVEVGWGCRAVMQHVQCCIHGVSRLMYMDALILSLHLFFHVLAAFLS